jgi:hypothetical protein
MLNFVENLLENERGPMNDQDLTKTDYDPDRSLVLIEGLSHFLTNFLQNLASCQTSFTHMNNVQFETRNFGHHCQYTVKKCKIGFTLLTSNTNTNHSVCVKSIVIFFQNSTTYTG